MDEQFSYTENIKVDFLGLTELEISRSEPFTVFYTCDDLRHETTILQSTVPLNNSITASPFVHGNLFIKLRIATNLSNEIFYSGVIWSRTNQLHVPSCISPYQGKNSTQSHQVQQEMKYSSKVVETYEGGLFGSVPQNSRICSLEIH